MARFVLGVGLAACSACGSNAGAEVLVKGFRFQPKRLTVPVGGTATWSQEDNTLHTITSGTPNDETGLFDHEDFGQGERFSFTFESAGTYAYFCMNHPEGMRGSVTVE
jgi:plastocyanin